MLFLSTFSFKGSYFSGYDLGYANDREGPFELRVYCGNDFARVATTGSGDERVRDFEVLTRLDGLNFGFEEEFEDLAGLRRELYCNSHGYRIVERIFEKN